MKFPFFASFIVFCAWLAYELHKQRNREAKDMESFWEKENAANQTRRKSLDGLNYITIPFDTLPMHILCEDPRVAEYHDTLYELAKEPIVNLTGITNTDLKLTYGAPNLNLLSAYDQRYTVLARTLQSLADALYSGGYLKEAADVLEFAVSTHTDISASYKLLITLYQKLHKEQQIPDLLPIAESLNCSMKSVIIQMIRDACPS